MNLEAQAKKAAISFRREHRLGLQPLDDLVALIEQTTGHDVAIIDADPDEHGLTMHDPDREVTFIGIARTPHPMRQRSTLAHELAHVLFEDWNSQTEFGSRSPQEIRADAFARHLLLPEDGLRELLGNRKSLSTADLSAVVQSFLVSPAIAAIALCECQYIDVSIKKQWMAINTLQLATQFGWKDQYESLQDGSNRSRAPQHLLARAISGYREGVVTAQAIATLKGDSVENAVEELSKAGITPSPLEIPRVSAADLPPVTVDLSCLDIDQPENPT